MLLLEQQLEARGQPQPCKSTVQQHTNSSEPGHHQARQENALHEDREPQRKNVPHCITPSPGQPHRNARGSDETRNMTESFRDFVGATRGVCADVFFSFPCLDAHALVSPQSHVYLLSDERASHRQHAWCIRRCALRIYKSSTVQPSKNGPRIRASG